MKTLLTQMEMAAHCSKLYNSIVVRMIEERQQSTMEIAGSDLIRSHGALQPVVEDADLWMETEQGVLAQTARGKYNFK